MEQRLFRFVLEVQRDFALRTVVEPFTADNLSVIVLANRTDLDPQALALKTADL
jgi:hypothetical protein